MLAKFKKQPRRKQNHKYIKHKSFVPEKELDNPITISKYKSSKTYVVNGRRYYVIDHPEKYNEIGIASFENKKKENPSNSEEGMTAASTMLPISSLVRVTNLSNNKSIVVKIDSKGPFDKNSIIDLSYPAAVKLDMTANKATLVQVTAVNFEQPIDTENKKINLNIAHNFLIKNINKIK